MASNASIQAILGNNVVEIQFVRRHPKMGWANIRGLLGTTNYKLLNSDFGRQVLFFQPPKGVGMGYPYKNYNLCVVWDIFRQEYRVFGAEQVSITRQWDVTTEQGEEEFQEYMFNDIVNMRNQAKLDFMGYTGITAAPPPPDKPVTVKKTNEPADPKVPSKIQKKLDGFYKRVGEFFAKRRRGK